MSKKSYKRRKATKIIQGIEFPPDAVASLRALGKWPPDQSTINKLNQMLFEKTHTSSDDEKSAA
jgi:hypothetical protein